MIDLALSVEHPFDAIAVHSLSRFYRDNVMRALVKRKLDKANVKIISYTQPLPDDQNTAYLLENMLGLMDEFNSRENSKHVIRCQRANAQQGFYNGSRVPYGYQLFRTDIPARNGVKKRLIIEPNESEVVKEIFRLADEGLNGVDAGVKRIADLLTNKGITNRGKPWRKQAIYSMLTNSVYMGEYVTFKRDSRTKKIRPQSEWIVVPVPSIVTKDTFNKVQESLSSRCIEKTEAKSTQVPTLLTGLLVCTYCRRNLTLMTGKSGKYRYYRCATKTDSSISACPCPNLPKEELESAVMEAIATRVLDPERVEIMMRELREYLAKTSEPDERRRLALQRNASMITERVNLLYDQAGSGQIDLDESLREYIKVQQRKLTTLNQEIELLRNKQRIPLKKFGLAHIENFSEAVKGELLSPQSSYARQYLRAIVGEIRITKAKVEIRGSKAQLAAVISKWKTGHHDVVVPSLVSEWRARRDSNS